MSAWLTIFAVAAGAAIASPAGGLIALWRQPTSLFMSSVLGFASGVLLGTIAFEMLPKAAELAPLWAAVLGFIGGFAAVWLFDLFIHRGQVAGERADQRPQVERFYSAKRPRGGRVTVLAGGTSAEELIEGLSIGVGAALEPGLGLVIALAIMVDNLSEALSIGEIIRSEKKELDRLQIRRILGWTSLIGLSLFSSAIIGWLLLRDLPDPILGALFAAGAGGMLYLTVSDLVPQAEDRHYQQSAGVATGAGFLAVFVLAQFL